MTNKQIAAAAVAKIKQGYGNAGVKACWKCIYFDFDDKPRQNKRCRLGGFAVQKQGLCDEFFARPMA